MKRLLLLTVLFSLFIPFATVHADPTPCPAAGWYDDYLRLVTTARDNLIASGDSAEVIADKALALYAVQFELELLTYYAPDCASTLLNKTVLLVALEADLTMLVILQSSGLGFTDDDMNTLIQRYSVLVDMAVNAVQHAHDGLQVIADGTQS